MSVLPVPTSSADPDHEEHLDDRLEEDESEGGGGRMSFLDHLDELRKRLTISISAVFVGFLLAFSVIVPITAFVMRPLRATLPEGGEFIYTEPTEAFFLYIKVAALVGRMIAIPVVLWQFWLFVAPGLYSKEKGSLFPSSRCRQYSSWGDVCSPTISFFRSPGGSWPASPPTT